MSLWRHENMANKAGKLTKMSSNMAEMGGDLRNTAQQSMHSSFYWGKSVTILFSNWPDNSFGMYILAFFFVFLLAVAAEVLSVSPGVSAGKSPVKVSAVQASAYAFRVGFTYLVMLSVMSFNGGIFIAAVSGHSLGLFLVKARAQALINRADPKV